ncbi:MAG: serine/threonine-protein kinase [Polyangiaceae bacterium]
MSDKERPGSARGNADSLAETLAREHAPGGGELLPGQTISPSVRDVGTTLDARSHEAGASAPVPASLARRLPKLSLDGEEEAGAPADFAVRGTLGEGGMGRVDLAVQLVFGREVALKRVRPDRRCLPAITALWHEAAVVGSLDHPNIVPVHAFGQTRTGDPVLVLKRVEGVPWSTLIHDDAHPAWEGRDRDRLGFHLDVLKQVCNAVESAHRRGVIHRDIKPENVMVGGLGEVYLLDWGIAVRVDEPRSPEIAGTPLYMAPEMLHGSALVTPRTDVYLLGATLHEVLTRSPRHTGDGLSAVLAQVEQSAPVAYEPAIEGELAAICNRATSRAPEDRFPSALAVREAIDEHLRHRGSLELCREGEERLAELHVALAEREVDGADTELASARARRIAAEADFAFRQARKGWPENAGARAGRRKLLEKMADFELSMRNAPGARALLEELAEERPELMERLLKLERERAAEAEARARLVQLGYEGSFAISASHRAVILGGMYALLGAVALTLGLLGLTLTAFGLLLVFACSLAVMLGLWAARPRTLLATQANRRLQATVMVGLVTGVVLGAIGWLTGATADQVFLAYYVLLVFSTIIVAIWSEPAVLLFLLIAAPPIVMSLWWPGHGYFTLAATCLMGFFVAIARARWRRTRPRVAELAR